MSTQVDSSIDICNLALDLLNAETITAFTDSGKNASQCNRYFAQCRRAVIRAHPWNFAMKRKALAQSTTTPVFDFTYLYPLPNDYLRVYKTNIVDDNIRWKIEQKNIATDAGTLKILYLFDNDNPLEMDALFIEVLVARMAWRMAYPITGDRGLAGDMKELYNEWMSEARGVDAQEGTAERIEAEEWLQARLAGPDVDVDFRQIEDATS